VLRLLEICNRSSFHQYPTDCLFSFESGPDIEMVSSASEFLGDTLIIWDNDCPGILYLKKNGCFLRALCSQRIVVGIHLASGHALCS
jgi:hypothetical protein